MFKVILNLEYLLVNVNLMWHYSLLNNEQISKISKRLFNGYLATGAGDL